MVQQQITTFLDDLYAVLTQLDLGYVPDVNIFIGREPPEGTDLMTCLYADPGYPGLHIHNQVRPSVEYPRARVVCRAVDYNDAQIQAEITYRALWIRGLAINGHNYQSMWPMGRPYGMGPPDAYNRLPCGFIVQAIEVI